MSDHVAERCDFHQDAPITEHCTPCFFRKTQVNRIEALEREISTWKLGFAGSEQRIKELKAKLKREREAVKIAVEITVDAGWHENFWGEYKQALKDTL